MEKWDERDGETGSKALERKVNLKKSEKDGSMHKIKDKREMAKSEETGAEAKSTEKVEKIKRLTEGPVFSVLLKLALPIIGASFVQMAYNLTDMYWVGHIGSDSLSAVGIAGFYLWLSMAFIILVRVGTEVKIAHRTGAKDDADAQQYARTGIFLSVCIAVFYGLFMFVFRESLIGIFHTSASVHQQSVAYLSTISAGVIFAFLNPVLGAIFNSKGYSSFAFYANLLGTVLNFIIDPLFVIGFGPVPAMGVVGAALATILSQAAVTFTCLYVLVYRNKIFPGMPFRIIASIRGFGRRTRDILTLGLAPAVHSAMFTLIGIVIGVLVSAYGNNANAVQKLGSQIESLSWMTAGGISFALTAFIGQNFGACEYNRVRDGYRIGIALAIALGIFSTILLYFFGEGLFWLFIKDGDVMRMGGDYLRILAISQLFMCLDITCTGIFNGLGVTRLPAIIGVVFNLIRIPMAYYFVTTSLGLNGVWWAITISSILKGVLLVFFLKRHLRYFYQLVD